LYSYSLLNAPKKKNGTVIWIVDGKNKRVTKKHGISDTSWIYICAPFFALRKIKEDAVILARFCKINPLLFFSSAKK
jgi:hypothetical protein